MNLGDYLLIGIFGVLVLITIGSAFMVAFSRNIVRSAFALLFTFFGVAGIYVLLGAPFIAGAQVLIYVGGVLVIILFAIMLTHKIKDINISNETVPGFIAGAISVIIFYILVKLYTTGRWATEGKSNLPQETNEVADLGISFLQRHLLAFEAVSVLLLAVIIGAMYLARKEVKK